MKLSILLSVCFSLGLVTHIICSTLSYNFRMGKGYADVSGAPPQYCETCGTRMIPFRLEIYKEFDRTTGVPRMTGWYRYRCPKGWWKLTGHYRGLARYDGGYVNREL
jgi:hypothetical protein